MTLQPAVPISDELELYFMFNLFLFAWVATSKITICERKITPCRNWESFWSYWVHLKVREPACTRERWKDIQKPQLWCWRLADRKREFTQVCVLNWKVHSHWLIELSSSGSKIHCSSASRLLSMRCVRWKISTTSGSFQVIVCKLPWMEQRWETFHNSSELSLLSVSWNNWGFFFSSPFLPNLENWQNCLRSVSPQIKVCTMQCELF